MELLQVYNTTFSLTVQLLLNIYFLRIAVNIYYSYIGNIDGFNTLIYQLRDHPFRTKQTGPEPELLQVIYYWCTVSDTEGGCRQTIQVPCNAKLNRDLLTKETSPSSCADIQVNVQSLCQISEYYNTIQFAKQKLTTQSMNNLSFIFYYF